MDPSGGEKPGYITVTATSPVEMLLQRALRFEPPLVELASNPDGFRFWWGQMEAVFDIDDPRKLPPLPEPLSDEEQAILERFSSKAEDLAASAGLNADGGMTISISDDGQSEEIELDLPPNDIIAGFAATFRQFYANDERASFKKVSGILMKAARAAEDSQAAERVEELRA